MDFKSQDDRIKSHEDRIKSHEDRIKSHEDINKSQDDRISSNKEFLQHFKKSAQTRRIAHECEKLYEYYPNLVLSYNSDKIELVVTETIDNTKHNYGFTFSNTYPFTAPQIYYNGESYIELLKLKNKDEQNIVRKYKNKDCLCCDSYFCSNNWSPSLTLIIIIGEIKNIIKFKRDIMNILFADKLKKKYLIDDIDINSYLI